MTARVGRMTPAKVRRESRPARRRRTLEVLARLKAEYPDADCALKFRNPLQLAVATILSAQCTDKRVNAVTPALFKKYPKASDYAAAPRADLEEMVRTTGFFRNKARSLKGLGQALVDEHGGKVPRTLDALVKLPGVGRKTANVILGNAFGIDEGVVVDTHVGRLARRFGFSEKQDPVKVERDLIELVPKADWTLCAHLLISHGRAVCKARKPDCEACGLMDLCPSAEI